MMLIIFINGYYDTWPEIISVAGDSKESVKKEFLEAAKNAKWNYFDYQGRSVNRMGLINQEDWDIYTLEEFWEHHRNG